MVFTFCISVSALTFTPAVDVNYNNSQITQLINYAQNILPFSYSKDYVGFSTDINHYYLFIGDFTTESTTFVTGSGKLYSMTRTGTNNHWSFTYQDLSDFRLNFTDSLICGSCYSSLSHSSWIDYSNRNTIYTFLTLIFLTTGFSIFLQIKRGSES